MPFTVNMDSLPRIITAIGSLGTAAFGLVDSTKVLWGGGVNRIGFKCISKAIAPLVPRDQQPGGSPANTLRQTQILDTLKANWYNGVDLSSQKAAAKSLIKLHLNRDNAAQVANAAGVDAGMLTAVANKIANNNSLSAAEGTSLSTAENNLYARFDFIVTALLDEAYQHADRQYTNGTRAWAMFFSIILAIVAALTLNKDVWIGWPEFWKALLAGFLATPLAPVAKDLSSALATAVNAMQTIKK